MSDVPDASPTNPAPQPALSRGPRISAADLAPLATLVGVIAIFAFTAPGFFRLSTASLVLEQGAVVAIAAVGLTFVLLCAEIDLSVGTMAVATACVCGMMFHMDFAAGESGRGEVSGFATAVVIVVPLLMAIALGFLSGGFTVLSGLPSFIVTLAMLNIADGLAQYSTTASTFQVPDVLRTIGNGEFDLFQRELANGRNDILSLPYNFLLALGILLVGHLVLQHTRFGRHVYMTGGNREAAKLAGVRTGWIVGSCLAFSAFTAGIAGLVNAGRIGSVRPDQNANLLLDAVACVVLGGTSLFGGEGGMGRTLLGVLIYTTLQVGLTKMRFDSIADFEHLRLLLLGVILLLALLLNSTLQKRKT